MTLLRPLLATLLALMLSLTSFTLAAARGQAPAAGEMVICSGLGLQTITVDADGNPVGPPHICPDGVAAFISVTTSPPVLPLRRLADGEYLSLPAALTLPGRARLSAMARGPPVPA
ncbi:MAG: hypothetical protein CL814_04835 [Confluentimicrobium sp.]|jgi:hypothetical protein|uniref:Secreted protein n=1 Tax=Actibacterium naphthalenivorans TaxID=1614693 RepID=A0A840CD18_9RHOB|nr:MULTISPECIES: hypothetical protein [Actibacterium]KGB80545.1 hypothetical protein JT55_18420 [Rhodovulum sp. NI22]MDY6860579.1 hypothetical protein [Pseudomonadota bacterium]ALG91744.1 hypothetical protein TQ29_02350 [Actibacterium sp. EMB200-NS6]MBB4021189.1 hypothetical protein [Actibacterium naphthalenivorans]MBC56242.1 hypothetical protein [Actibacterium sp.]